MEAKCKYIQNTLNTPITANIRKNSKGEYDIHGAVVDTIEFKPTITDKWSGKVISTGYTKVTEEQYEGLVKSANTWRVYGEKKKLLVVHDDVPADLKTPHEAIRDARKALVKSQADNKRLEAEIVTLKAELHDADEKYKQLSSASTDDEKLKAAVALVVAEKDKSIDNLHTACNENATKVTNLENELREITENNSLFIEDLVKCEKLSDFKALVDKVLAAQEEAVKKDFE